MNSSRFTETKKLEDAISSLELFETMASSFPTQLLPPEIRDGLPYLKGFAKALLTLVKGVPLENVTQVLKEHFVTIDDYKELAHSDNGNFRGFEYLKDYMQYLVDDLRDLASDIGDLASDIEGQFVTPTGDN